MRGVGIAHHRVFPHDVEGPDLPPERRRHHLPDRQTGLVVEPLNPPGLLELLPRGRIRHRLIAGKHVGKGAHVAGALDVVLPPQRVDPRGRPSDMAGQHGEARTGFDVVRARRVLGDAHGVDDHRLVGRGVHPGRLLQIMAIDPGNLFHDPGAVTADEGLELLESLCPVFNVLPVKEALFDDDVHHPVQNGDIRADILPQVQRGKPGQLDLPRIDEKQLRTIFYGIDHPRSDEGMLRRGVGTGDQEQIRILKFPDGIGHRSRTECGGQTDHRCAVSEPGAVIDIVGAERRPGHLHEQIVFLIGHLRGTQKGQRAGTGSRPDVVQPGGNDLQRLIPGALDQRPLPPHEGNGEPVGRVDEFIGVPSLYAEHSPVHGVLGTGLDPLHPVVFGYQIEAAAAAAEGTYRPCSGHGQIASFMFSISV